MRQICERNLRFFFLCLRFKSLSFREMRYLFWRYAGNKNEGEIARLDGRRFSQQRVSFIIRNAEKKIKQKYYKILKNNLIFA